VSIYAFLLAHLLADLGIELSKHPSATPVVAASPIIWIAIAICGGASIMHLSAHRVFRKQSQRFSAARKTWFSEMLAVPTVG
jgi:tryptophan-rich sensory protein